MFANLPRRTPTSRPSRSANSSFRSGRKQGGFGGRPCESDLARSPRQNYFECGLDKTCVPLAPGSLSRMGVMVVRHLSWMGVIVLFLNW